MRRTMVRSSIRGRRGQRFLRRLREALDAMPDRQLASGAFIIRPLPGGKGPCYCAVGLALSDSGISDEELLRMVYASDDDYDVVADVARILDVAPCLVREVMRVNDHSPFDFRVNHPAARWRYVRSWVARSLGTEEGRRTK